MATPPKRAKYQFWIVRSLLLALLTFPIETALAEEPLKLAVTDIVGMEELLVEYRSFQETLSRLSQIEVKLFPVTSRTVIAEALRSKQVDLAICGPAEYVVLKQRTDVVPLVSLIRPSYYSAIIVLASSNLKELDQLRGKKIGFGDIGSTSYHIAPMQILADAGINPQKDLQPIFVDKNVAWQALKRGDIAAFGMNHDRFLEFCEADSQFKLEDFKVLAKGVDLPGDLIVAAPHIGQDQRDGLRKAFAEHSEELLEALLQGKRNQKYRNIQFNLAIKDSDYDVIRKMYATIGYPEYAK